MSSRAGRVAILVGFAAVAVVLFALLRSDSGDDGTAGETTVAEQTTTAPAPPPQPAAELIVMRDGAPVGGVRRLTYAKGDEVRIKVKLDQPQEDLHIHGYDIEKLNPSGQVSFNFSADIEGIFELEAHGPSGDVVLAEIRVEPA